MAATEPADSAAAASPGSGPGHPAPRGTGGRGRPAWGVILLLVAVALVVWGLDQFSKYLVVENLEQHVPVPVIGELLQFRFVKNSGAAFSLASGFTWVLSIVAASVVVVIVCFAPRIRSRAWAAVFGLILGGAFGNLTDRLFREPGFGVGHVVDFIQLGFFPAIFNLADIAISASMVLFVTLSFRGVGLDGHRRHKEPVAPVEPGGEAPDGAA